MKLKNLPPDRIAKLYAVFSDDKPHLDPNIAFADSDAMKMKKAIVTYSAKTRHSISEENVATYMSVFATTPRGAKYILPRAFEFWPNFYLEIISMIVRREFHSWTAPERAVVLEQLQFALSSTEKDIAFGAASSGGEQAYEKGNLYVGKQEDELFEQDAELALILCENFNLKK